MGTKRVKMPIKNPTTYDVMGKVLPVIISTDGRSNQGHRCGLNCCKIKREVVCVTFVHDFHSETCSVEDVCPGVEDATLSVDDRLVEVESIEVECHCAYAKGGEPDSDYWPCSQEEVE